MSDYFEIAILCLQSRSIRLPSKSDAADLYEGGFVLATRCFTELASLVPVNL